MLTVRPRAFVAMATLATLAASIACGSSSTPSQTVTDAATGGGDTSVGSDGSVQDSATGSDVAIADSATGPDVAATDSSTGTDGATSLCTCDPATSACLISYGPPGHDGGSAATYSCTPFNAACDAATPSCACAVIGPFCTCADAAGEVTVTCPFHP